MTFEKLVIVPSKNSSDSNLNLGGRRPKLKSESFSEVPFYVMRSFDFCARPLEIAGSVIGSATHIYMRIYIYIK